MENGDEDRISALPDYLLVEILSRLGCTESAIRTGTLSKRWKDLWTSVDTLIFDHSNDMDWPPHYGQDRNLMSDFVSFVDKTLTQCRQLKLKKFQVFTPCCVEFESQVNTWIHYAIRCNVEELCLVLWSKDDDEFSLDQSFFINTCFSDLTLSGCILNPIGAISWKNLSRLCIFCGKLDEYLIENILSGSPVLETLVLCDCYGYRRLDITSKSVKNLVLNGYEAPWVYYDDLLEINAPDILSLTIRGNMLLWKLLLVNVSSVVEANLDYIEEQQCEGRPIEEMLEGFIMNLRHVNDIKIGSGCARVVSRLEAKGFVFPSNIKLPSKWLHGC